MNLREEIEFHLPFRNMDMDKGIQITINVLKKRIDELNPKESSPNIENWGVQYFMGYNQAISVIKEMLE